VGRATAGWKVSTLRKFATGVEDEWEGSKRPRKGRDHRD
jgi:hypothetical protein